MQPNKLKFTRKEFAGAFGDIGTDLPLLIALIVATGLYAPSVLIIFGLMQIITGFYYKMPMPVQPLKAMATIVISQKVGGDLLLGAGLSIGIFMLLLSGSGLLQKLWAIVPIGLIRGLQMGLGLSLCSLAIKDYVLNQGTEAYIMASLGFLLIVILLKNNKYPASLILIILSVLYGLIFKFSFIHLGQFNAYLLPVLKFPSFDAMLQGFLLLSLPQIPLSIGNSILATKQTCSDYFPNRTDISLPKLGFSYALMNLIAPLFGGVPVCHGAGGLVGHYTFGGRTGASVIIYGFLYVLLGLLFGTEFSVILVLFPLPVLGIILFFEGFSLISLVRYLESDKNAFILAVLSALIAFLLPYGYVIALVVGIVLNRFQKHIGLFNHSLK